MGMGEVRRNRVRESGSGWYLMYGYMRSAQGYGA